MSNLDKDIAAAAAMGISYGKYMLIQTDRPVTKRKPVKPAVETQPDAVCKICGKLFRKKHPLHQCCSVECKEENNRRKTRERYNRKASKIVPLQCPFCKTEFVPRHRSQKFCCKKCQTGAEMLKKRIKSTQEEKA